MSIKAKHSFPFTLTIALALVLCVAGPGAARAFTNDITATGNVSYDTANSFSDPGASHDGAMTITVGGAGTRTTFADGSVTLGANPLPGTFTILADGVGITGQASSLNLSEYLAGVDFTITVVNASLTKTYEVALGVVYTNTVDADGADAYATSEFTLDEGGSEVFFTDIQSDTVFGDELNGVALPSFGALVTDVGVDTVTVTLAPGASNVVVGAWTLEGGGFDTPTTTLGRFRGTVRIGGVLDVTPFLPIVLSGRKFEDLDADGTDNGGADPGLAGVTIELWQDGGDTNADFGAGDDVLSTSVLSQATGVYSIPDVGRGLFFVRELTPTGSVLTASAAFHTVTALSGVDVPGLDFGNAFYGSLHGHKFEDVDGNGIWNPAIDVLLPGVEFTLTGTDGQGNVVNRTATTDASGRFDFTGLLPSVAGGGPGTGYTVTETVPPGFVATTPTSFTSDLSSREGLVAMVGYAGLAPSDPRVEVLIGVPLMFGNAVPGSIHGHKFEDVDGDGVYTPVVDLPLAGVAFALTGTDGQGNAVSMTTTTDAAGQFHFTGLRPGAYAVTETVPPGHVPTTPTLFSTDLASRQALVAEPGDAGLPPADPRFEVVVGASLMFGNTVPGSIHGFKFEDVNGDGTWTPVFDQPLPGVQFTLTGTDGQGNAVLLTTTTDGAGQFHFTGLMPSSGGPGYTVTETVPVGHVPTTPTSFSSALASREELVAEPGDAGLAPGDPQVEVVVGVPLMFGNTVPGSIHGFAFADADGNGSFGGPPDAPLPGMAFALTGTDGQGNVIIATTTTDASGNFAFTGLMPSVPGTGPATGYAVNGTPPAGYLSTTPTAFGGALLSRQELVAMAGGSMLPPGAPQVEIVVGVPLMFGNGQFDFGDAPDPTYPVLLASDGARHAGPGPLQLGAAWDAELDGQPSAFADGDDVAVPDDEDGVVFTTALLGGLTADVTVNTSGGGLLDAWIDFNADGDWSDAGEQIFTSVPLAAGDNALSFVVPSSAVGGASYARFRLSSAGGLAPDGRATDGEVEDYPVDLTATAALVIDGNPIPHDTPAPLPYGTHVLPLDTVVTNCVMSPADEAAGTRYRCTGWTGTGDVPPAGTTTCVTFTLSQDSLLVWNWQTQHYLALVAPSGSIAGASEGWYDDVMVFDLTAEPSEDKYALDHWLVDGVDAGSASMLSITTDVPKTVTAVFRSLFIDASQYATATFDNWSLNFQTGTLLGELTLCNVSSNVDLIAPFWYAVAPTADLYLVNPDGTTNGLETIDITAAVLAALPGVGDGDTALEPGECVTILDVEWFSTTRVPPAGTPYAVFADPPDDGTGLDLLARDTDGDGTPNGWEDAYGLDQNDPRDGSRDSDGDGMCNAAEYQADTDPGHAASVLRMRGVVIDGAQLRVRWTGGRAATQHLYRARQPRGPWTCIFTNRPPTGVEQSHDDPAVDRQGFYRVGVPER